MKCVNCGKEVHIGGSTCPWCGVLLSNHEVGVVASAGLRLAGYVLDGVVWFAIMFFAVLPGFSGDGGLLVVGLLVLLAAIIISFVLMSKGKSYGKWILGLRVYQVSGQPAGFFTMLIRDTIGKFVSGMVFSLGYLWLLWDRDRQTWHDKLMGTVVMVPKKTGVPQ